MAELAIGMIVDMVLAVARITARGVKRKRKCRRLTYTYALWMLDGPIKDALVGERTSRMANALR